MACPRCGKNYKEGFTCTPVICVYKGYAVAGIDWAIHRMIRRADKQSVGT